MTTLETFNSLNNLLTQPYSPDYWADVMRSDVSAAVSRLNDTSWEKLVEVCAGQPAFWQDHLASALFLVQDDRATEILMQLLTVDDLLVVVQAAETLIEKGFVGGFDNPLRPYVEQHLDHADNFQRRLLERLLVRLPV